MSKLAMPAKMPEAAEALPATCMLVQPGAGARGGRLPHDHQDAQPAALPHRARHSAQRREAEDIVQEAYVRAFANLATFAATASLATWLSRIVINEALGRLRKRRAHRGDARKSGKREIIHFPLNPSDDPERTMAQRQILALVERATDSLPDVYRTVFVARVIEGLSIEETADLLGVRPETVKTRLHRARTWCARRWTTRSARSCSTPSPSPAGAASG